MARNMTAFIISGALLLGSTLMFGADDIDTKEKTPVDPNKPLIPQIENRMGEIKFLQSDFTQTRHLKILKQTSIELASIT